MTDVFLQRLTKSSPTVSPEDSDKIFAELLAGDHGKDWVQFSSEIITFQTALALATGYVGTYSEVISTDEMSLPSEQPISVFGADKDTFSYIGLLYSNGAVMYAESKTLTDSPILFVFLDKTLVNVLKIPFVDLNEGKVFNATEQEFVEAFKPEDDPVDNETE